ncbi:uroporphyrinogen-III synthase [Saliterribacillus persicus]|uniref:Uroporphyrinogen-III synthase n=1 Tax=Saliterribacillus persicus TaxID=930114 RepID=A0A368XFQ9_9BACI|nr:uroporphyrinogen-III synthase [Saliterribacillus persicus]RCW65858.1 uroporphyrinogen-III synthase [Saliterribacillus persicus]
MDGLQQKQIGIAADRRAKEISTLIQKQSGIPVVYSIQGKQQLNEEISSQDIKHLLEEEFDWAVLTTGIGARTLENTATAIGIDKHFIKKLRQLHLAIRGSKTSAWLKEHSLEPTILSEDGTMDRLLQDLRDEFDKNGPKRIFLQAYNQDDAKLKNELETIGYSVYLSKPYSFEPPTPSIVNGLREAIIEKSLDAVVFTSKTQVINLFADNDRNSEITAACNEKVLAVAVGKVTAQELKNNGIKRVVEPDNQKMGAMIVALNNYYNTVS